MSRLAAAHVAAPAAAAPETAAPAAAVPETAAPAAAVPDAAAPAAATPKAAAAATGTAPWPHRIADALAAPPPRLLDHVPGAAALRPASVLMVLAPDPADPSVPAVLLTERCHSLAIHAGQVSLPGGRLEPGDRDGLAAALREAWEEVALEPTAVTLLGRLDDQETSTGFRVQVHVAWAAARPRLVAQPAEVARILWMPLTALLPPVEPGHHRWERDGRTHTSPAFVVDGATVWGATARMLMGLRSRLGA